MPALLDAAGQVVRWPRRAQEKQEVLLYLAGKFEPARGYSEAEVNALLKAWHRFGDWALLRRELVVAGLLRRDQAGTRYERGEINMCLD